jgi:hypothetical protein
MRSNPIAFIFLFIWQTACTNHKNIDHGKEAILLLDTIKTDSIVSSKKTLKPVFGFRFIVTGDFNGDGKKEKLTEHFFSALDHREANKFYENVLEYDDLIELTLKKRPYCVINSDNKKIGEFTISLKEQQLGLSYLKNEGDLNGDGTDELSYVINWADRSNLNTWHIVSFQNNKWKDVYSFPIWDWQIPDLPETFNDYGMFGLNRKTINSNDSLANDAIETKLNNFKGLVKKITTNKIQITFRNEEAMEETKIVKLRRSK